LKECRHCKVEKELTEFSPAKRGTHGVAAYCRPCFADKYRNKDRAREATARYRARHPERWKAAHRIHQFNRRSNIKATDDGTVTDKFLKELYSRMNCYWCGLFVDEEDRTLEHVVELNEGGAHSASNIEMACMSCNSARLGRTK
jgi:hypothetical protein